MNKMEELIDKYCPDGVEYLPLSKVCSIKGRVGWQGLTRKEYRTTGDYLLVTGTDFTSRNSINFSTCVYVDKERYSQDENIQLRIGDVLITKDGTLGKMAIITELPKPTTLNGGIFVIRDFTGKMNQKFIMYYMLSSHFRKLIEANHTGSTIQHLTQNLLVNFPIPIPPLPVQDSIVRILDTYTELEAELEAELELRKKQYEYYKETILSSEEWRAVLPIKDCITSIQRMKWNSTEKEYQYIDLSSIDRETGQIIETTTINKSNAPSRAQQIVKENDTLFGTTRPLLKRIGFITKEYDNQVCSTGYCVLRPDISVVVPKWLYYVISANDFFRYVEANQIEGSYPSITDNKVKEYLIPVPPIPEQEKIVSLLDKFDTLCNDITQGLPRELELRRKQYEYYRDKLLTFKRKEV